jgi:putative transposase
MKAISQKALSRLAVIGPMASRDHLEKGERKLLIQEIASKTHHLAGSKRVHVNEATIERWYYAWKRGGVDALEPKPRKDRGNSKFSAEIQAAILAAKKEDPSRSIRRIIQTLVSNRIVGLGELSRSGVYRFLLSRHLNSRTPIDAEIIERRRFVAEKCGQIWQADVLHGPRILIAGKYQKVYLVSFMDDASRLITHSEFRLGETELDIQIVLKQALLKRGMPSRIIIDNGPAYRSGALEAICARLKIHLVRCRPYEPQGKGKLEKWHARFRDEFLRELDLTKILCLLDLNSRLWAYLEQVYHVTSHQGLENKMTPIERWRQDLANIRQLGLWATKIDEIFYHRVKRRVRKDGCISLNGKFFEVPFALSGNYVVMVFDPATYQAKWVESEKGEKLGDAILLDQIHNTHRKRQRPQLSTTTELNSKTLENPIELTLSEYEKTLIIKNKEGK